MTRTILIAGILMLAGAALAGCGGSEEPAADAPDADPMATETPEIAFDRELERDETSRNIWVMDADGSAQIQLTDSGADEGPVFSPDGRRIAFTRWDGKDADIYVMNTDGSDQTRLTENPGFDGGPAWSPDGQQIAFGSERGYGNDKRGLYVMNADGSEPTRLASGGLPTWSPDGKRIAFTDDGPRGIYLMNADGSGRTRLTDGPEFDDLYPNSPAFSPDGRRIAFLGLEEGTDSDAIWVMKADGSDPTKLTARAAPRKPTWSPDGNRIAFVGERDGRGIYVMNSDGTDQTRLPDTGITDSSPAWSPASDEVP